MRTLLFAILALVTFNMTIAQETKDSKSQAILDKLSTKIKGYKSFYIEFSASIKSPNSSSVESETGKGWVKDKKFYASYGDNTIISNGLKTWTVVKEEKEVYEADANDDDEESLNPKKLMSMWETGFKNKYEKEETLNGESVHVIYLYPKSAQKAKYHTIILYISKSSNELKKAIMKAKDSSVMTYVVTKFDENVAVDDSKFVFDAKKYPGYKIVKD